MNEFPATFSWEDINGYDFTGRHIDQARCGSCYTLSVNGVLESRIKIQKGKEMQLSPQFRLDCDFLNEGCHGGWGFIDGIFLKHYYTTTEECAPYLGDRHQDGCSAYQHCPEVAKVSDAYYVGGHYGNMNEEIIIKELRSKGPVLIDFNAD